MEQLVCIEKITKTIIDDNNVEAVFLKGDITEDTHDEFSIIELYLLTTKDKIDYVLDKRIKFLESYQTILYHFFVFFSCPQIIAVYDNGVRVKMFVTTIDNLDLYGKALPIYDPKNLIEKYHPKNYALTPRDAAQYFNTFNYTLLDFEAAYMRQDIPYMFRLTSHLLSDLTVIFRMIDDSETAKLGTKGIYNYLDYEFKREYKIILEKFYANNLLDCVTYMLGIIDSLIMKMPLEIGQHINYDFHLLTKRKIHKLHLKE